MESIPKKKIRLSWIDILVFIPAAIKGAVLFYVKLISPPDPYPPGFDFLNIFFSNPGIILLNYLYMAVCILYALLLLWSWIRRRYTPVSNAILLGLVATYMVLEWTIRWWGSTFEYGERHHQGYWFPFVTIPLSAYSLYHLPLSVKHPFWVKAAIWILFLLAEIGFFYLVQDAWDFYFDAC